MEFPKLFLTFTCLINFNDFFTLNQTAIKQRIRTRTQIWRLPKAAFLIGLLTMMCLKAHHSSAGIIPASSFSEMYASMPSSVSIGDPVVNSDMVEGYQTHEMKAIAISDANGGTGSGYSAAVWVEGGYDAPGFPNTDWLILPNGAKHVDVAISNPWNYISQGFDYKLVLTYCIGSNLYIELYDINNNQFPNNHALTPFYISTTPSFRTQVSSSCNGYPHVDMWALNTIGLAFVNSMYKFAVVWSESSAGDLYGYVAATNSPSSSPFQILAGLGSPTSLAWRMPDVSCLQDMDYTPYEEIMEISYGVAVTGAATCYAWNMLEFDYTAMGITSGYPITLPTPATYGGSCYMPKIESANFYPGDWSGTVKWQTVANVERNSGGSGPYQVLGYNNLNASGTANAVSSPFFSNVCMAACVCAGVEIGNTLMGGGIGNHQYTIGFWNSSSYELYARDIASAAPGAGTFITPSDVYEVNQSTAPMSYTSQIAKNMAISTCSNTGRDILTAWYDGYDVVYKISQPDVMQFKMPFPKDITLQSTGVTKTLHLPGVVDNTRYGVIDASGKIYLKGNLNAADPTIDVSALPRGAYILKLWQPGAGTYIQKLHFSKL